MWGDIWGVGWGDDEDTVSTIVALIEHTLNCPVFSITHIEHLLKINDVLRIDHPLMIGQWTSVYVAHSLPVLMTTTTHIDQPLLCPLAAINPTIQQEHRLSVPMLTIDSLVINVHVPETPLYGAYS